MGEHSIIPPSSAGIWGKPDGCTGWVLMTQQYPEIEESEDSKNGSASHEIGQQLIKAASIADTSITRELIVGQMASNGVIYDDDMFDAAEIYADDVISVMRLKRIFGGGDLGIEKRVKCPSIHEISFGTTDCFIFDRRGCELFIWDYKYGYELVEAFENWQELNYLSGLIDELNINGIDDQNITVHIRIVQPRAFHRDGMIREWTVKLGSLRGYFNIISNNAHKALSNDAECHSGDHCKNCTARYACDAGLRAGLQLYEVTTKPIPIVLSPLAMGVQLSIITRARKQLEYLESGFKTQVESLIRSGINVPGWAPEMGFGHEKWNKPVGEIVAMGQMFNTDLKKPDSVITPVQARKLGIDDTVISAYSAKSKTGMKIVPDNGNKAKEVFIL